MSNICYVRLEFEDTTNFTKTPSTDHLIFQTHKAYYQHYFFIRLSTSSIKSYVCGIDASPPGYTINKRRVSESFLIFVVKGKGTLNGTPFYAGQFFLLPPDYETTMISDAKSPWTLCWIAWRGFISESFERIIKNFKPCQLYFNPNNSTTLKMFASFIYSDHSHADVDKMIASFSDLVVSMYEKDIVPVGMQNQVYTGTNNVKYVEAAKKIMAEEYATITIEKLSERLFLNRRYFCEVFKSVSDISPQEYLINLRLKNSLLFLDSDSMTLKQISAACGYSSYNGYVEAFRKKFGMTPKEYRKKHM